MTKKDSSTRSGPLDAAAHPAGRGQEPVASSSGPEPARAVIVRAGGWTLVLLCAALCVATLAVYAQTYRHGFIDLDDNGYVFKNPHVKEGLTASGTAWAFTTFHTGNWHPLTWLSHMLDCQFFGLEPGPQHLVNVGLHVANALLVFIIFARMTGRAGRSAIVAGIFALHPLHVESVAWIAERKDVLSTFFGLLALFFYARYAGAPSLRRYVPVFAALALGLLAKSMLVTLPFVFLLVDVWPLERLHWPPKWASAKRLLVEKVPLFLLAAGMSVVAFIAQERSGAVTSLGRLPFGDRFAGALVAYAGYIGKALWPTKLAVLYPYEKHSAGAALAALAILAAITIVAALSVRKRPFVLVGWLWYLGMLVPVIGLVQIGAQSMADRYTYLPLVGLSAAIVWLVAQSLEGRDRLRSFVAGATLGALLLLGLQAHRQAAYWQSSRTLFEHALAVTARPGERQPALDARFERRLRQGVEHGGATN